MCDSRFSVLATLLLLGACSTESSGSGKQPDASGGSGGEGAAGGYIKGGGAWDGTAGNPYGYPQDETPSEDCGGFGFNSAETGLNYESCAVPCETPENCPSLDSGPTPACEPEPVVGQYVCVLPCAEGGTCPEGMACIGFDSLGLVCLWPKDYR